VTLLVIDSLLGFFGIWAISGDVPFVLPMVEVVFPLGFLACVFGSCSRVCSNCLCYCLVGVEACYRS